MATASSAHVPDALQTFLSRLDNVRRAGSGWKALCPVHGDHTPSLVVKAGDKRFWADCKAHDCGEEAIMAAVGLTLADMWYEPRQEKPTKSTLGRIVKTYDYRDPVTDEVLYQAVRYDPKTFRQRRPPRPNDDPKASGDGWVWNLTGVKRVIYHAAEVRKADPNRPVLLLEGEKDVERAEAEGFVATTTAQGAKSFKTSAVAAREELKDRIVVVIPDADDPGDGYAETVEQQLAPVAKRVIILRLPGLEHKPDHGPDLSDWLDMGHTADELRALIADALKEPPDDGKEIDSTNDKREERSERSGRGSSIAQQLIALAAECEFFHDEEREAWVTFPVGNHYEMTRVNAGLFWDWLEQHFHRETGRTANAAAKQQAQGVFRGRARFDGVQQRVHVRLAEHDGATYLDLADEARRAVKITPAGWDVLTDYPVKFWRPRGMLALPAPARGGSIGDLRKFVNVSDEEWPLLVAFLVECFRAAEMGGHPVLAIGGEQGSGKSTLARIIRRCVDPNRAPLRDEPADRRDLAITARNSRILVFDNLSDTLPNWLSNGLCRISTGGGHAARQLYTDADEFIFDSTRPVVLTSIADVASKSDLVDRSIFLSLPRIKGDERRQERVFWPEFEQTLPGILGALLDAAAGALTRLPELESSALPRMADFAQWAIAAEPTLGFKPGTFLKAYRENRAAANKLALDASLVAQAMLDLVPAGKTWKGTSKDLLAVLNERNPQNEKKAGWPGTPRALSGAIRTIAPNLRAEGFSIPDHPKGTARGNVWTFSRAPLEKGESEPPYPPQEPPSQENCDLAAVDVGRSPSTSTATSTPTSTRTNPESNRKSGGNGGDGRTDTYISNVHQPSLEELITQWHARGVFGDEAVRRALLERGVDEHDLMPVQESGEWKL